MWRNVTRCQKYFGHSTLAKGRNQSAAFEQTIRQSVERMRA